MARKKSESNSHHSHSSFVTPPGFEPRSQEPESCILSVELWGRSISNYKLVIFFKSPPGLFAPAALMSSPLRGLGSNPDRKNRNLVFYPLNYGAVQSANLEKIGELFPFVCRKVFFHRFPVDSKWLFTETRVRFTPGAACLQPRPYPFRVVSCRPAGKPACQKRGNSRSGLSGLSPLPQC